MPEFDLNCTQTINNYTSLWLLKSPALASVYRTSSWPFSLGVDIVVFSCRKKRISYQRLHILSFQLPSLEVTCNWWFRWLKNFSKTALRTFLVTFIVNIPVPRGRFETDKSILSFTGSVTLIPYSLDQVCVYVLFLWLPWWFSGRESAYDAGDAAGALGSVPGLGISLGAGNGNRLQDSCLGSPIDRGAWRATVHGVTKSWTWPSD